jgi:hypothetical protein
VPAYNFLLSQHDDETTASCVIAGATLNNWLAAIVSGLCQLFQYLAVSSLQPSASWESRLSGDPGYVLPFHQPVTDLQQRRTIGKVHCCLIRHRCIVSKSGFANSLRHRCKLYCYISNQFQLETDQDWSRI